MGTSGSKKKGQCLNESQRENILKMFDARSREKLRAITSEVLQNIWKDTFSDSLLITINRYLFKHAKEIEVEDLECFYYMLIEGTILERAETLMSILGIEHSIPPKSFQSYVSDLIESYLIILRKEVPEAFSTWKSGDLAEKNDMAIVAKYFVSDIIYKDGRIDLEELTRWLSCSGFVASIFESVMKYAFNMDVDILVPVLPIANKHSSLLRIPTALALSHLIKGFVKEWRLLYSSSTDENDWNVLQKKIFHQGPTIVLIQDKKGPLFGGFASQSWKYSPHFYGDVGCFLFQLRPKMAVCRPSGYNENYQYMNHGSATMPGGMGMGGQVNYFGFFLSSEFGLGSVSKTCTTFMDYNPPASENEFTFSRLEIWGVGKPDLVKEHDGLRNELAMKKDPTGVAILELAGKIGHSKNIENY